MTSRATTSESQHQTPSRRRRRRATRVGSTLAVGITCCGLGALVLAPTADAGDKGGPAPLPATSEDFLQGGTQPQPDNPGFALPTVATQCEICHGNYSPEVEPWSMWKSSMLGQSARDPVFWAAITIAEQDVDGVKEYCIRCHAPNAFLAGEAPTAHPDTLSDAGMDGVNCVICHRIVNPEFVPGESPEQDEPILAALADAGLIPVDGANAQYIIDPADSRRGPFDDLPLNPHPGSEVIFSPFHSQSELCWTCHDVSNPLLVPGEGETESPYVLGALGEAHPSGDQLDQFPIHRTYSEWKNSYYSTIGVQHDGRFGGNHPDGIMKSCQDCHMPDQEGFGCGVPGFPERPNVPQHSFLGANTWVLRAVLSEYGEFESGLTEASVEAGIARNVLMLEKASDLELGQEGNRLTTRVINRSGHKLPTGFPDGRRVWINVRFLDAAGDVVQERGAYDFDTATLIGDGADTVVFEASLGMTPDHAASIGRSPGKTFNFVLANTYVKDNRIPPAGWSNTIAEANQMEHVGAFYANGQNWHDADWTIPFGATEAVVTTYYQTTSREFIEFLRDENTTDTRGQEIYDLWELHGKSQPVPMDVVSIELGLPGDFNEDGSVGFEDLVLLLSAWGNCPPAPLSCPADIDGDGVTGFQDLIILLSFWSE